MTRPLLARVIPGLRLLTYTACGFVRVPLLPFTAWVLLAVALWTPLLVGLSALFGEAFGALFSGIQHRVLPGLLLGPFAGALGGELMAGRGMQQAARAGIGAWIGFVVGTLAKLGLAFTMLGVYLVAWLMP